MQASDRIRLLLVLPAGAVLPLAYAPFDLFWVAPAAYAVLFYAWGGARPQTAFGLGFAFGAASFLAGLHWIYISVNDFGEAPAVLAAGLTVGLVAVLAAFVGAAGFSAARWFPTRGARAWWGVFPALWVLGEWCRGWLLSGFGWLAAGYSQTESWLMGYAPLGGIHAMSWAVVLSAGALLALAFAPSRQRLAALAALAMLWGAGRWVGDRAWAEPRGQLVTVALVQGAVPQELKWRPEQLPATLALYRRLTEASEGSALIVWPEAAIPAFYEQVAGYLEQIRGWAAHSGSVVMLGILKSAAGGESFQNTLVALTDPPVFYVKRHLVPFGEYFPVPGFVRSWMRLRSLPYTDATPGGDEQRPLAIAGERLAVTICYEDVFGAEQLHYFPEATLLVNVSNDAWFGDSIAPHQHLQIARVRAAEVRRYLLRSTNTGISAIVDPRGRVTARSPQFEPHVLKGAVQGFTGSTPYARWGNYPVVIGALIVLLTQLPMTKLTIRPGT